MTALRRRPPPRRRLEVGVLPDLGTTPIFSRPSEAFAKRDVTRAGVRFILGMEHKPLNKSTPPMVGGVVVIHGLQRRAELNGQTGTLLSFDAGKGRWAVQLAAEIISIKTGTGMLHSVVCFFACVHHL